MARYDAPSRGSGKQNTFFGGAAILAVGTGRPAVEMGSRTE